MSKFDYFNYSWLNKAMKNSNVSIKEKIISKYLDKNFPKSEKKSSDINVLLNRIKVDRKNESRKKLYFSAAASTGLLLFGFIIF